MTLRERLKAEITTAMRSGDALRRDTLRMAENAIYNAEKRDRRTYPDDEVAAVIAREVKTRRESVEAFRAGHREDLATKEEAEIEILGAFLPAQLSDAELAGQLEKLFNRIPVFLGAGHTFGPVRRVQSCRAKPREKFIEKLLFPAGKLRPVSGQCQSLWVHLQSTVPLQMRQRCVQNRRLQAGKSAG